MNLNANMWYVTWFFWSHRIWDAFNDSDTEWYIRQNGTNLCYFLRVMLIWAPLVLLAHVVTFAAVVATITYFPFMFFGGSRYAWGLLGIAVLIVLIWGIKAGMEWLNDIAYERRQSAHTHSDATAPSFWSVVSQWIRARKQKICPMIVFVNQEASR